MSKSSMWRHPFQAGPVAVARRPVVAPLALALDPSDRAWIRALRPESHAMWVATLGSAACSVLVYGAIWGLHIAVGLVLGMWAHELGHQAVLRRLGIERGPIVFVPLLGAVQRLCAQPRRALDAALLALAGPICGLAFASACKLGYAFGGGSELRFLGTAHAILAAIDLLPFGGFDGKRTLTALRSLERRAARAALLAWLSAAAWALWVM